LDERALDQETIQAFCGLGIGLEACVPNSLFHLGTGPVVDDCAHLQCTMSALDRHDHTIQPGTRVVLSIESLPEAAGSYIGKKLISWTDHIGVFSILRDWILYATGGLNIEACSEILILSLARTLVADLLIASDGMGLGIQTKNFHRINGAEQEAQAHFPISSRGALPLAVTILEARMSNAMRCHVCGTIETDRAASGCTRFVELQDEEKRKNFEEARSPWKFYGYQTSGFLGGLSGQNGGHWSVT